MRVFVCSTVFLLVLTSIYIMSVSALCQTIMDAVGKPKRATELAFAAVLVGPVTLAPPVGLWFALRRFLDKHNIERLPEAKSGDEYRGWLERFADREVGAPMWETAVASLVLSFAADKGAFAVVQLLERALATIVATCLVEETAAQLGLAIAIEVGCMVAEYVLRPFTDAAENAYNLVWRGLAVGILFVALLIEAIGEPFYVVGDVLLVLLTTAAVAVFLYALDVPRMRRALQRHFATMAFRKALFPADNRDNDDKANMRSHLRAAVEAVPESISKAAVV